MAKRLMDFVAEARSRIVEINCDKLNELMAEKGDLLVLDVREPQEYAAGHIQGAVNVPRGVLEGAADATYKAPHPVLSKAQQRPVAVVCATGGRSAMATDVLMQMGFADVVNVAGGFEGWKTAGLPVVQD